MNALAEHGSHGGTSGVPSELSLLFRTAIEFAPEDHLRIQAALSSASRQRRAFRVAAGTAVASLAMHDTRGAIFMATAGEFCNRVVAIAKPGESLSDAARRMLNEHVGCLVVVKDDPGGKRSPTALLTDRDIVVAVLARTDRHLDSLTVGDVMTRGIVTAKESESLEDVLERMRSFGIRRIPIVNEAGGLEGLISFDDLLEFVQEQLSGLATLLHRERKHEVETRPQVER